MPISLACSLWDHVLHLRTKKWRLEKVQWVRWLPWTQPTQIWSAFHQVPQAPPDVISDHLSSNNLWALLEVSQMCLHQEGSSPRQRDAHDHIIIFPPFSRVTKNLQRHYLSFFFLLWSLAILFYSLTFCFISKHFLLHRFNIFLYILVSYLASLFHGMGSKYRLIN